MSSFGVGAITGGLNFDVKQFTGGMAEVIATAGNFPGVMQRQIDAPLAEVERQFNRDISGRFSAGMANAAGAANQAAEGVDHLNSRSIAFGVAGGELAAHSIETMFEGAKKLAEFLPDLIGEVANTALSLSLLSERAGVGIEFFSGWVEVGKRVGVTQDTLSQGFKFLQRNAVEAAEGNQEAMKSFAQLGIGSQFLKEHLADVSGMFQEVYARMQSLPNQAERVLAATKVLGRGGEALGPLFDLPLGKVEEMIEAARRVGAIETEEGGKRARTWKDLEVRIGESFEGMKKKISEPFMDTFIAHWNEIGPKVDEVTATMAKNLKPQIKAVMTTLEASTPLMVGYGHLWQWIGDQISDAAEKVAKVDWTPVSKFASKASVEVWRGAHNALLDIGAAFATIGGAALIAGENIAGFANHITLGLIGPLDRTETKLHNLHAGLARLHDAMANNLSYSKGGFEYQKGATESIAAHNAASGGQPLTVSVAVSGDNKAMAATVGKTVTAKMEEHYSSMEEKFKAAAVQQRTAAALTRKKGGSGR